MTGMRFFVNLIPEAVKHRPRQSRAASRFSREPRFLSIPVFEEAEAGGGGSDVT